MVWSPDFASKVLKLKKRSDFYVGPFFHAFNHHFHLNLFIMLQYS